MSRGLAQVVAGIAVGLGVWLAAGSGLSIGVMVVGTLAAAALVAAVGVLALDRIRTSFPIRWWHIAWLLLLLTGLTWRQRGIGELTSQLVDSAAAIRAGGVLVAGLAVLGSLLLLRKVSVKQLVSGTLTAPVVLGAVGITSSVWSVYPTWTLYRSVEYTIDLLFVGLIVTLSDRDELHGLVDLTYGVLTALLASVFVGVILWPGQAILTSAGILGFQVQGVLPAVSANGVGDIGAVLAIVSLARLGGECKRRGAYAITLALGVGTMFIAQSRSPILAFAAAALVVLVSQRRLTYATGGLLGAAMLWMSPVGEAVERYLRRGQSVVLLTTLSGRVDLYWMPALQVLSQRWLNGFGAYAGGRFAVIAESSSVVVRESGSGLENTFLETALGTGALGVLALGSALVVVWLVALRLVKRLQEGRVTGTLVVEAVGILTIETVRSFFSAGPFIWHPILRFALVLMILEWHRRRFLAVSVESARRVAGLT